MTASSAAGQDPLHVLRPVLCFFAKDPLLKWQWIDAPDTRQQCYLAGFSGKTAAETYGKSKGWIT